MATRRYGLPQGGSITIREGTEGERHDPWDFKEITLRRRGRRTVLFHEGIASWTWVAGRGTCRHHAKARFLHFTGFRINKLRDWCHTIDRRKEEKFFRETALTFSDIAAAELAAGWDPNP
jgi:hypothetical protein